MVDDVLLMKYMQGQCSEKETDEISRWLEESEENGKAFRDAHHIYESVLMSADPTMLKLPRHKGKSKKYLKIAAGCISAAAAIAVSVLLSLHFGRMEMAGRTVIAEVPAGKMMTLTLDDGSRIDLNSGARLEYPPVFCGRERSVTLEGEAMFHVSHDKSRPFKVNTFAAQVEVLGTEFNVNADKEKKLFSASLVSGSVRVTDIADPSRSFELLPDQSIVLAQDRLTVREGLDPQARYWPEGLVNIAGIPFDELMERFEKVFDVNIIIDRQTMPVIECTSGEIRVSDGMDRALKILQHVADFDYETEPGSRTVRIK